MKKAIPKTRGGKRLGAGRPATGRDPVRPIRMSDLLVADVKAWAKRQPDKPSLSAAIRRLVEQALGKPKGLIGAERGRRMRP